MNNIFSFNRFTLLFKKHSIEHAKTYLLSIAVLAGLMSLVLGFTVYSSHGLLPIEIQNISFYYFILGAGSIFTSLTFTDLGDKKRAPSALTLPASHFEKYLVSWLYSFVIFQLVLIGLFYLINSIIISISIPPGTEKNTLINIFDPAQKVYFAFIIYALFHAFTIWGAIFFEKLHFIKTAFVFFLCLTIILMVNGPLLHTLISKDVMGNLPFLGGLNIKENEHYWHFEPGQNIQNWGKVSLTLVVAFLWVSSYFRLKEKEI